MARILNGELRFLAPVERGIYAVCGIDPNRPMRWQDYTVALLLLSVIHLVLLYAILRLQFYLPFNPQHIAGMSPRLAFNTAASFATNTNWQAYVPEQQISNGAQMFGLAVHMFISAAAGIAVAGAVMRASHGLRAAVARQLLCRPHTHHPLPAAAGDRDRRLFSGLVRLTADLRALRNRAHALRRQPDHRRRSLGDAGGRSRNSAPTAAASSTPTLPIPSRTRRFGQTFSRTGCCSSSASPCPSPLAG